MRQDQTSRKPAGPDKALQSFQQSLQRASCSFQQLLDSINNTSLEARLRQMWPPASAPEPVPAPRLQPFDNFFEME